MKRKSRRALRKPAPGAEANEAMLAVMAGRDVEVAGGAAVASRRERLRQRNALREGGRSAGDSSVVGVADHSGGVIVPRVDDQNSNNISQQNRNTPHSPICSDCEDDLGQNADEKSDIELLLHAPTRVV